MNPDKATFAHSSRLAPPVNTDGESLSHHRAYRSAHGGSFIDTFDSPVIIQKENITGLSKTVIGDRCGQDRALGCMPVAFSCIRKLPSLI